MDGEPDIIIFNGKAMTFDPLQPSAEALAIAGDRILAVGSSVEIRQLVTVGTRLIDAGGSTILPGFIDSHVHLFVASAQLGYLNLAGVTGKEKLREVLEEYADQNPADAILFGVGASYAIFDPRLRPTREDLDEVFPRRPFAMMSGDNHTVWANTAALRLCGIILGGPVEQGAEIVVDDHGMATGELRETSAFAPIISRTRFGGRDLAGLTTGRDPAPTPTASERARDRDALAKGLEHCARHGITGLHNMDGNAYTLELLEELRAEGRLLCRIDVPFHYKNTDGLERISEAEAMRARWNDDMLSCRTVKMFADGVIKSRTALMIRPYPDAASNGHAVFDADHFRAACVRADALGFQIAVHAIGDLAVRSTLDAFEAAMVANGRRDSRHRIEHIETIHPDDMSRFAELGVIASLQPGHAPFGGFFDKDGITDRLHPDQIPYAFAAQRLRDAGATVAFSTDWPVMPVDVMANIQSAVAPVEMPPPWRPEGQRLGDALLSYTATNSFVQFTEDRIGRLSPGMQADVVLLDKNIETLEPTSLSTAKPKLTVCGGIVTWKG